MDKSVKAVVCDFDGTFSTLRCGWEAVMKRMMMKYLPDEAWIDSFIGETFHCRKGYRKGLFTSTSRRPW